MGGALIEYANCVIIRGLRFTAIYVRSPWSVSENTGTWMQSFTPRIFFNEQSSHWLQLGRPAQGKISGRFFFIIIKSRHLIKVIKYRLINQTGKTPFYKQNLNRTWLAANYKRMMSAENWDQWKILIFEFTAPFCSTCVIGRHLNSNYNIVPTWQVGHLSIWNLI